MEQRSLIAGVAITVSAVLGVFAASRAVVTDDDLSSGQPPPAASAPAMSTPVGGTVAEPVATVEIDMSGSVFSQPDVTIAPGTEVIWTNLDSMRHSVTASDFSFDSGTMEEGDTFSFVFTTAGTFPYYCNFHPNMTATITVEG